MKATLEKMEEIKFEDFFNKTFSEIKDGLIVQHIEDLTSYFDELLKNAKPK